MKIKADFVTNSSSASFILFIQSTFDNLEKFKESWDKYLKSYIKEHEWIFQKKVENLRKYYKESQETIGKIEEKIKNGIELTFVERMDYQNKDEISELENLTDEELQKISLGHIELQNLFGNTFEISSWRVMFNDFSDIPKWMSYLVILHNMNPEFLLESFGFKNIRLKIEEDD